MIPSLSVSLILDVCREYDATHEDFEKILLIEGFILPVWRDRLASKLEAMRNKK